VQDGGRISRWLRLTYINKTNRCLVNVNSFDQLSDAEQALVDDFVRKSVNQGERLPEGSVTFDDDLDRKTVQAAFEQIESLISNTNPLTLRVLTLERLKREIESKYDSVIHPPEEMPADPKITREDLNRLLIKDEVTNYFLLVGGMIEQLSIDLICEKVISEDRQSENQRTRVEQMSQAEREQLLYMTSVIGDGERSEIRRAYNTRNDLAHNVTDRSVTDVLDNVESDIERAYDAVEILHMKLYDIDLNQRFSNLLVDD